MWLRRIFPNLKVLKRKIWALVLNSFPQLVAGNTISLRELEGISFQEPMLKKYDDELNYQELYNSPVGQWLDERGHAVEFEMMFLKRTPGVVGSRIVRVLHIRFFSDVDLAVFKLTWKYHEYK